MSDSNTSLPDGSRETVASVVTILKAFGVLKKDAADELPHDRSTADLFLAAVETPSNAADSSRSTP